MDILKRQLILPACLLCLLVTPACGQRAPANQASKLVVDPNGFVLNVGKTRPRIILAVGMPGSEFLQRNPSLKAAVWLPQQSEGQVFDEMRFSLQAESDVTYTDGDFLLQVCAHSLSADGNHTFKNGVAFVGIKLCASPINDYKRAVELAKNVIDQIERNTQVRNLGLFYQTASPENLEKVGGSQWKESATHFFKTSPARRENPDSGEFLYTPDQALSFFAEKAKHVTYHEDIDGLKRPTENSALVGVYAGRRTLLEIGINSANNFGGTNLTTAQKDDLRYDVTIGIRFRNDVTFGSE